METAGIYHILHVASGRRYIGASVHVVRRLSEHKRQLRGGRHHNIRLQRAWHRDGEDAFEFRHLVTCAPTDLDMYEIALIEGLQTSIGANGYNISGVAGRNIGSPNPRTTHNVGDRHWRLELLEIVSRGGKGIRARYRCDCGNEITAAAHAVRRGITKSCGCLNRDVLVLRGSGHKPGDKFNRLRLIERVANDKHGKFMWRCLCDCGNETIVKGSAMATGEIKSCGCLTKENGAIGRLLYQQKLRDQRAAHLGAA